MPPVRLSKDHDVELGFVRSAPVRAAPSDAGSDALAVGAKTRLRA